MCERECLYCMCMYICVKVIYYVLVLHIEGGGQRKKEREEGRNGEVKTMKVVHFTSFIFSLPYL